jgi:hypothetical protein
MAGPWVLHFFHLDQYESHLVPNPVAQKDQLAGLATRAKAQPQIPPPNLYPTLFPILLPNKHFFAPNDLHSG